MKNKTSFVLIISVFFFIECLINVPSSLSFNQIQLSNFIKANQIWGNPEEYGGFKNSLMDINASIDATAKAIISLKGLQVRNQTIYDGALLYISGLEQFNGGYSTDSISNIPSLKSSYWAISALHSIQSLDWVSNKTMIWIADRQLSNQSEPWNYGGFENKENASVATIEYSFCGIAFLSILNQINLINKTSTAYWLSDRQLNDGGFESLDGMGFSDLASSFYAISTLTILNGPELINQSRLISFLGQKQNLNMFDPINYGGFGNAPNISCSIIETYFVIKSLHLLDALDTINMSAATSYIESLQLDNGAFTIAQGIEQPSISSSYYALIALDILALHEDKTNPEGFSPFLLFVFILGVICISSLFVISHYHKKKTTKKFLRSLRKRNRKNSYVSEYRPFSNDSVDTFKNTPFRFIKWERFVLSKLRIVKNRLIYILASINSRFFQIIGIIRYNRILSRLVSRITREVYRMKTIPCPSPKSSTTTISRIPLKLKTSGQVDTKGRKKSNSK